MKIEYIKSGGITYYTDTNKTVDDNYYLNVRIKKLLFGRFQVDYFDTVKEFTRHGGVIMGSKDTPNTRMILYPSGIEEVCYEIENHKQKYRSAKFLSGMYR